MLLPMITALGAVGGAAGGLAYAQRLRRTMIAEAVAAGQAVGALAAVRAMEEGQRTPGDAVAKARVAAKAAKEIGFVAVRHQLTICRAVEDGKEPVEIAAAMDGPCCMAARRARLRDDAEPVNAQTFAHLLGYVDQMHAEANAPASPTDAAEFRRRLAMVIIAEAALVLAWLRFTRDARAEQFGTMIATDAGRARNAKEIHRLFRLFEAQARDAAGANPAAAAAATTSTRRRRVRRDRDPSAEARLSLAAMVRQIAKLEATRTDPARVLREKAVFLVKYLRAVNDPAWRAVLEELGEGPALVRRRAQIESRYQVFSQKVA